MSVNQLPATIKNFERFGTRPAFLSRIADTSLLILLAMILMTVSVFSQSILEIERPDKDQPGSADLSESSQYFQGFEIDNVWGGNPLRVATGTDGISSRTGGFHAKASAGNFTRWGGYSSVFPSLGFTTSVDVYFNMAGGFGNDTRFDFSSAASQPDGNHRRDFIFNCGFYSDGGPYGSGNRFVCSSSNNSPGNPRDPGRSPVFVDSSGWYTLKHTFRNNGGVLAVDMVLLDSVGSVKGSWTLSDPTDIIGTTVGGNRYGWFVTNGFPFLAIDNSKRANIIPSSTVKVTPVNYNGWMFYDDDNDAVNNALGSFVTGPATPNYGSGSAQISVIGLSQRVNLATYQFSGTPLADINELKFRTYNPSAGNGGSPTTTSFLVFNVDFNGSDTWQRRLVFVPSGVTQDNWKEWDAIAGGNALWSHSGPTWPMGIGGGGEPGTSTKTWGQILSQYPGIRMRVTDSHLGIRVGNPDPLGYTENIDSFTLGTATSTTTFDFDPAALLVDDNTTECPTAPYMTIQAAINAAAPGATVSVCAGTYNEDINVNKAGLTLVGAGVDISTIIGQHATGGPDTVLITAPNVTVDGFTITRTGNTDVPLGSWAANTHNQGVNVAAVTGVTIQNSKITGNRNGIYVGQSSHNTTIRRNIIDFNRTGVHLVDNNNALIEENFITNNWTMGILYREELPVGPDPTGVVVRNNNISGNWFSQIEFREPPGSSVLNMSGNYLGTTNPTRVTTTSLEPGYNAQIPAAYPGGSAVAPGSPTGTIAGPQSARVDYSPFLNSGTDTQPGTPGFQGNFSNVTVNVDSASSSGPISNIQDGINVVATGGTVTALAGTYPGNVLINKAATLNGNFTIGGTLSTSNSGAVVSPGLSPGIINSGNLTLNSGATVSMEINGLVAGTFHDQLNVTGTVDLGGANLNLSVGYIPMFGQQVVIVNNDGADAVTGTFAGLPEGSTVTVGFYIFTINYAGGSNNNDVVLTATPVCETVSTPVVTSLTTYPAVTGVPVTIPVTTSDLTGAGVIGVDFTFDYDPTVMIPDVTPATVAGTINPGAILTFNAATPGSLVISLFDSTPFASGGTLVFIKMKVIGQIGSSTPLTLTNFRYNNDLVCSNETSGSLTVIGSTSGRVWYSNTNIAPNAPGSFGVPNVTMTQTGPIPGVTTTDGLGDYSLTGIGNGVFTITPSRVPQDFNAMSFLPFGIKSNDPSRIAQHVVGLITLTGRQLDAAKVSGLPVVSSFDAALIAQWIVGSGPSFPGNQTGQWKFFPTNRTYTNVIVDQVNQDYDAVLMGDTNGDWVASPTRPAPTEASKDAVRASVGDIAAAPGTTVTVPFRIDNLRGRAVSSYQFDVEFDPTVISASELAADLAGTIGEGLGFAANSPMPGLLKVVVFGAMPVGGDGVYVNLRFSVIGGDGTTTRLALSNFSFNDGSDEVTSFGGRLSVGSAAENTTIRGRTISATGRQVAEALVTLTSSAGESRSVVSQADGSFEFGSLTVGETYTVFVQAKLYTFTTRTVSLAGSAVELDMIGMQ